MKRLPLDIGGEYYGNYGHFAITDYDQLADACVRIRASFDMPRYRRPRRRVRPSHPPCTLTDSYTNAVGKAVVKA